MEFDKIVYLESERPGSGVRLTVDFGIGEITARSASGGGVMWRRLAGDCVAVIRMKIAACHFDAWNDEYTGAAADGPCWSLELIRCGRSVKLVNGRDAVPERWPAFASLVDLCFSLAECRAKGQSMLFPPAETCAAFC